MNFDKYNILDGDISTNDLQWILENSKYIAVDTETTGLDPQKSKLSLVQIAASNRYFLIRFHDNYSAKNLVELLNNEVIYKIFHHATFDVKFLMNYLGCKEIKNVVCTKIAAKLLFGPETKTSLKNLIHDYFHVSIDKRQQLSDWTREQLSDEQIEYAINDVRYLVDLWLRLESELKEKGLLKYARNCFFFLPTQAFIENQGIPNIFQY
ncbi:ribonuclease D [Brevibacillus centrosporus]|uniref:ribonuclease D n=1 Tax=Brevibacillus centrosporus TaxID=54910 RepID=UPI000F09C57F|nr:ribonuclease D [Brevibacillus centrosporus]MEC2130519.1 ribonuclease D [Brevibacillus centrosporus]RNB68878.1 ribonuclease D [Brevibacillus centrosporus]GED34866.1 ribonuclease D [Brevibacillus centrosporus]